MASNRRHLEQFGPSPSPDLPARVDTHHRADGIRKFTLHGSQNGGGTAQMGGKPTPIYYLEAHDRSDVVRAFLEANPGVVDVKTRRGFTMSIRAQGPSWVEAAKEVADEFFGEAEPRGAPEGPKESEPCPLCGAEVKVLPSHLAGDCGGEPEPLE